MAHTVREDIIITAPLKDVWAYTKPFDTFSLRLFGDQAEITNGKSAEEVGAVRDITVTHNGTHIIERLTHLSDEEFKIRYELVSLGVYGLRKYEAEVTLRPATPQPVHLADIAKGDSTATAQATSPEHHPDITHITLASTFESDDPSATSQSISALYASGLQRLQAHFEKL
eukprot:TRINITY_DN9837_c0_g1_i1.p1 TRINITY_DN9837_c0_g1~~TRINITY_DN9837_c0_g1_i1.p1  ORF type:complete len:171 (+),score=20.41 TRINITY_DN9837_c0_g1_i1:48-560(+)